MTQPGQTNDGISVTTLSTSASSSVQPPFDLSGRTALVTGSSRGIGFTLAVALARSGARVILHGRDSVTVAAAVLRLREQVPDLPDAMVMSSTFDVADEGQVRAAFADFDEAGVLVDVAVCNAGIQHREALLDVGADDFRRVLETNLVGVFLVAREAARRMMDHPEGHGGRIIAVASIQAELARPSIGPYASSKGGVQMLVRSMCAEWAELGITVNALAPGYIETELTAALVADPTFSLWVTARTPAKRWGKPEDLTGTLLWLASPSSAFVNGQTVFVDGGMSAVV